MNAAICTLFEGHYHYGVATLSNSLYNYGFRGTIYVGYRGQLPDWSIKGKKETVGIWQEAVIITPATGLQLVFLQLTTTYSLTNYKPDFMLDLWEGPANNAEALFYFDPDIVIQDSWICFEQWVNCGVSVCEDVNSPFQEFHPRRVGWRNYFKGYNLELKFKNQIYVNGGFIGLLKKDISFLKLWKHVQESMAKAIGGLENSIFSNQTYNSTILKMEGFTIFDKSDQDALNAAIEAYNAPISYIGKEGMGFAFGKPIMYHALGSPKPWKANYLKRAFQGKTPKDEHSSYWENTLSPILAHSNGEISRRKMNIKIARLIGRFYKT